MTDDTNNCPRCERLSAVLESARSQSRSHLSARLGAEGECERLRTDLRQTKRMLAESAQDAMDLQWSLDKARVERDELRAQVDLANRVAEQASDRWGGTLLQMGQVRDALNEIEFLVSANDVDWSRMNSQSPDYDPNYQPDWSKETLAIRKLLTGIDAALAPGVAP